MVKPKQIMLSFRGIEHEATDLAAMLYKKGCSSEREMSLGAK